MQVEQVFHDHYENSSRYTLSIPYAKILNDNGMIICELFDCIVGPYTSIYPTNSNLTSSNIILQDCTFSGVVNVESSLDDVSVDSDTIIFNKSQPGNVVKVNWLSIFGGKGSICGDGSVTVKSNSQISIFSEDKAIVCDGHLEINYVDPTGAYSPAMIDSLSTVIDVARGVKGTITILDNEPVTLESTVKLTNENDSDII